jgi:hypothetical protein
MLDRENLKIDSLYWAERKFKFRVTIT